MSDYELYIEKQAKYMDNLLNIIKELEGKFENSIGSIDAGVKSYIDDVKAHLKEVDEKNVQRYELYLKTTKLSAIATLIASGRGIKNSIDLVERLEAELGIV